MQVAQLHVKKHNHETALNQTLNPKPCSLIHKIPLQEIFLHTGPQIRYPNPNPKLNPLLYQNRVWELGVWASEVASRVSELRVYNLGFTGLRGLGLRCLDFRGFRGLEYRRGGCGACVLATHYFSWFCMFRKVVRGFLCQLVQE